MNRGRRPALSIRTKLVLIALCLLVVPWVGYHYVQDLEQYLRTQQAENLLARARLIANSLNERPDLFAVPPQSSQRQEPHLYIRRLSHPIQVDGYADDWAETVAPEHTASAGSSLRVRHRLGVHGDQVYAVFQVRDDQIIYRPPGGPLEQADHIRITMANETGERWNYKVSTLAPGWISATPTGDEAPGADTIRGQWQETADGYTVELRLPVAHVPARLGFSVVDRDEPDGEPMVARLHATNQAATLETVALPSPQLQQLLERLVDQGARLWVTDADRRVIALAGHLEAAPPARQPPASSLATVIRLFYRLILPQPPRHFQDELATASRLEGQAMAVALAGQPATRWRLTPDDQGSVLTATHPVRAGEQIIGAVAVEETKSTLLLFQNRALEALITLSALAWLLLTGVLLAFATRLSWRIRRLRAQADQAVAADGRVRHPPPPSRAGDELGDLSRTLADTLERLAEYNRYLETMASKLAHELRTPITVVRSSLDNLEQEPLHDRARPYVQRARDGLERLHGILNRMREATRVEQTLQQEHPYAFDLAPVVAGCVEGYNSTDGAPVTLHQAPEAGALTVHGVPERLAQLLDNLVANARDFAASGTEVEVILATTAESVTLSVRNQGPPLPAAMQGRLFDSMVSIRESPGAEPHLGLGLYIVRLIAEFHSGSVHAADHDNGQGAVFSVHLPRA